MGLRSDKAHVRGTNLASLDPLAKEKVMHLQRLFRCRSSCRRATNGRVLGPERAS